MSKFNTKLMFWCLIVMTLFPIMGHAQNVSVNYKNQSLEKILADLKQKTNFQFVYQKQILDAAKPITASYTNVPLSHILDRVLFNNNLDYEIVDKTVIIRVADKEKFKKVVSGRVVDETGAPLAGAYIRIKDGDANNATASGLEGEFSISVETENPIILFSFIGMLDKELLVTNELKNPVSVVMRSDVTSLNEIIVTGYQNIKKESATGAYQKISSKEMDSRYTTDIVSNLEGKIPGLVGYNNGKNGEGESTLTIRGVGTFQAKTQPLIVVDGLPIEGSIETVNRYDIESITVLKDASAASIYGARASNGVIVITTKRAKSEKLIVDASADLTLSDMQTFGNFGWANASQVLDLERYNFDFVRANEAAYGGLLSRYETQKSTLKPITRLMIERDKGIVSESDYNAQIESMRKNDYRKEWQDLVLRRNFVHQYNLALRSMGKYVNSNVILNYKGDNTGHTNQYNNALNLAYKGEMMFADIIHVSVGLNLIKESAKTRAGRVTEDYYDMHSFGVYQTMYNPDGSHAAMQAMVPLDEPNLSDSSYGFKSEVFNYADDYNYNFSKSNRTNIRSYVHANVDILKDLTIGAKFQYEDISYKNESLYKAESYGMRNLYNLYTSEGAHHIPEGSMLKTGSQRGAYYTFRTQAAYTPVFKEKHVLELNAGFEYREAKTRTDNSLYLGYDDQTQTNLNNMINFYDLAYVESSDLGKNYIPNAFNPVDPQRNPFATSDILHRFYSYYFTGNYTYDKRYSVSASYRVDRADLFGADPKFRGRPLWSAGLSWNISNESFMEGVNWIDMLKLRASYGLTGNIDSSVSSYLTATITNNDLTGDKMSTLNTPPNDQLRWEKTASWNIGADFAMFQNRLSGSLDVYNKKSSDLLSLTDIDPTTGWPALTINNGEALNKGVELMLGGEIIRANSRCDFGISANLSMAYNKNEVTKVDHEAPDGFTALSTLHKGYPINSLFSWRFAGYKDDESGNQQTTWYKADGSVESSSVSASLSPEDIVYSGSLDPKVVAGLSPEITWKGFSLSAMLSYYAGHKMRAKVCDWTNNGGSEYGYNTYDGGIPASYLNYWTSSDKNAYKANGYAEANTMNKYYEQYMDCNVVSADYFKLRNIVLSYQFSKPICQRIGIGGLRLRLQVNNVATWAKNNLGIDPEANNPLSGVDTYKVPRSYTLSLNINF